MIAIADSGVDFNHPDLTANIWSAPEAFSVNIGGQTINCGAGSHGFNAISNNCDPGRDTHGPEQPFYLQRHQLGSRIAALLDCEAFDEVK